MKKRLFSLILSFILMISLAACGTNKGAGESVPGETDASNNANNSEKTEAVEGKSDETTDMTNGEDIKSGVQPVSVILGTHAEMVWEAPGEITNEKKMAEYRFFDLMLSEEDTKEYPKLAETLDKYSKEAEKTAKKEIELLVEAYNDYFEYAQESERQESVVYMEETSKAYVLRADSSVVSVCYSYYDYFGGTHGTNGLYGQNFDTKTGENIKFSEVITDEDRFYEIVDEKLKNHPEYGEYYKEHNSMDDFRELLDGDDPSFIIDNEGVIIVFNPYSFNDYSWDLQIIKVLFSEAPEIFNEKYTAGCDSYVIPLLTELRTINTFDTTGDGNRLPVVVDYDYGHDFDPENSEYQEFISFSVSVGKRRIDLDYGGYDIDKYVVKTGDKYYFLAFVYGSGDWVNIVTVDLSTMKEAGRKYQTGIMADAGSTNDFDSSDPTQYRDSERMRKYAFTTPDRIVISPDIEILGNSHYGRGVYSLDASTGELVLSDEGIEIDGEYYAIKTKRMVPCEFVTYDGKVKNAGSISSGTYLCMIRTDGETWADFQAVVEDEIELSEEWTIYPLKADEPYSFDPQKDIMRIHLEETDEYYKNVDGIPEDEVFDGIIYAG